MQDVFKECAWNRRLWEGVEESCNGQREKLSCDAGLPSTRLNHGELCSSNGPSGLFQAEPGLLQPCLKQSLDIDHC